MAWNAGELHLLEPGQRLSDRLGGTMSSVRLLGMGEDKLNLNLSLCHGPAGEIQKMTQRIVEWYEGLRVVHMEVGLRLRTMVHVAWFDYHLVNKFEPPLLHPAHSVNFCHTYHTSQDLLNATLLILAAHNPNIFFCWRLLLGPEIGEQIKMGWGQKNHRVDMLEWAKK